MDTSRGTLRTTCINGFMSSVVLHLQNYAAGIRGHYHKSSVGDCFEYPPKSLLKSRYPKKYLPNFPTPKNPGIENFKPKKILRSSLPLETQRPPPPPHSPPPTHLWLGGSITEGGEGVFTMDGAFFFRPFTVNLQSGNFFLGGGVMRGNLGGGGGRETDRRLIYSICQSFLFFFSSGAPVHFDDIGRFY